MGTEMIAQLAYMKSKFLSPKKKEIVNIAPFFIGENK